MSLVALFGDTILTSAGRLSTITIMLTTVASFEKKFRKLATTISTHYCVAE